MITRVFFLLFLFIVPLQGALEENGAPSQALVQVLERFGVCNHTSWKEIVDETQEKWLRKPNQERWQIDTEGDASPETTYGLFSQLEMTQERLPKEQNYDYALIFGATEARMERRLAFLKKAWLRGVRFKQLVWLVGDRPSDPAIEKCGFENETAIAKDIYATSDLPADMRSVPVIFVDTPRKEGQKRPTTIDTLEAWLKTHPKEGSTLFIADAPFMNRQGSIARKTLPPHFTVEIAGYGFSLQYYAQEPRGLAILLDELARWIYFDYGSRK
jgi:hypothetical protein